MNAWYQKAHLVHCNVITPEVLTGTWDFPKDEVHWLLRSHASGHWEWSYWCSGETDGRSILLSIYLEELKDIGYIRERIVSYNMVDWPYNVTIGCAYEDKFIVEWLNKNVDPDHRLSFDCALKGKPIFEYGRFIFRFLYEQDAVAFKLACS